MKRTTIKSFGKPKILDVIINNNSLILIFIFLIAGVLAGCLAIRFNWFGLGTANPYFNEFLSARSGKAFFSLFLSSLLAMLPYIAINFLSGTCMVGSVVVPLVAAYRGFYLGGILGFLYLNHGLMGILFNVLLIIPAGIISSFAVLLSGREAFGFSIALARLVFPGKVSDKNLYHDFKLYCSRQIFIILLFVIAALLDALLSVSFLRLFNF
jgi:membrane protein